MDKDQLREKAISRTRNELESSVDRDDLLAKAVKQHDELENDIRNQVETLRDWYSVHFPELESELSDDDRFVQVLQKHGVERSEIEPFSEMAAKSTGSMISVSDREMIEGVVDSVSSMIQVRDSIEEYVRNNAAGEFENLSSLLGPLLASRLVSLAGGLEELAQMPASTVQMLGAEKALFRHLKGNGSSPKHGVLFEHRFVKDLPEDRRGKMARFLANKTVIAARVDQYGDEDKSEKLNKELEDKYSDLSPE
ncbi:MAG: ribosomal biogenesis protein Nop56/Nop58 [Candidatus Nanosalina sp. J07AB43]|nr:MAG: ribosomal biogenesis protein Nop56/Nop58 [Candidatus Nanosalina sp. J07AB43]